MEFLRIIKYKFLNCLCIKLIYLINRKSRKIELHNLKSIWSFIIICICLVFTIVFSILCFCAYNSELEAQDDSSRYTDKLEIVQEIDIDSNFFFTNQIYSTEEEKLCAKENYLLPIFTYVFLMMVLDGTIIGCVVIIIKDDQGVRFSKLKMLNSLNTEDSEFQSVADKLEDYEIIEEETTDKNCNNTVKKTTKKKNLNAELLKHYMDIIAEI